MDARILRDFFLGKVSTQSLAADAEHAYVQTGSQSRDLRWKDLDQEFVVSAEHLVRLCDAVISGELPADRLDAIAFGMIADDRFLWDTDTVEGNAIGETLNDWSAPEVNYALNAATLAKFRHRLLTGEDTFTWADLWSASA